MKKDYQALALRESLDPKRFMKGSSKRKGGVPEEFAVRVAQYFYTTEKVLYAEMLVASLALIDRYASGATKASTSLNSD